MTPVAILALVFIALPLLLAIYAYAIYPLLLLALARRRPVPVHPEPAAWPMVTIVLPAYNEVRSIATTIENVLRLDYPRDRLQVVVVSDASTDGTDDVVRGYAARGVELLRLAERSGKTAAENAADRVARSDIVVNTDASVRVLPQSLKPLVRAFGDASVGVASGRDVSTGDAAAESNGGESGYVGYEMWVRGLETRVGSIVGASGCFYAFRRGLFPADFPVDLSRDFASALLARERGWRAVSVDDALCVVPRTVSLDSEFRRKVRTMARGLSTLGHMRHLLDPVRHGTFAWMLASHKLCRWLVYPASLATLAGAILLAMGGDIGRWLLAGLVLGTAAAYASLRFSRGRQLPRALALPGFVLAANLAGMAAWLRVFSGQRSPIWDPTRRPA